MTKTQMTRQASPVAKKAAGLLLSLQKLYHHRMQLWRFCSIVDLIWMMIGVTIKFKFCARSTLAHFVGYSTDYDRILPMSMLRNFRG
jgi:hypothetical protein